MGRTLGLIFLFAAITIAAAAQSASALAQNPNNTPNVMTVSPSGSAPVTSGALPLPAPPEAALPGSGTPVGAPPNVDLNNAAQGGSGAVVQPNAVVVGNQAVVNAPPLVATPSATPQNVAGPEAVPSASEATQPTVPVASRTFAGSASVNAPTQPMSLGELSAQVRGRKPLAKRTFDNSDIMALNDRAPSGLRSASEDLPQSDQPVEATPQGKPPVKKQPPQANNHALDQSDLRKVEEALQKSKDEANKPK